MKHPVGSTRNGATVYVNLIGSKAAAHISQQPRLLEYVKEALAKTSVRGAETTFECDMGRAIGYNFVVATSEKDSIFYAQLAREDTFTRFVKNGEPLSTQYLTVVLSRDGTNNYELLDTWIGRISPAQPGTEKETDESKSYWETHALVLENQPLQLRTVTKTCPY